MRICLYLAPFRLSSAAVMSAALMLIAPPAFSQTIRLNTLNCYPYTIVQPIRVPDGVSLAYEVSCNGAVEAGVRGNTVVGRFYGPRAVNTMNDVTVCSITADNDNMTGCIFLPASGSRYHMDGALSGQGTHGRYWSSVQLNSNGAYSLNYDENSTYPSSTTYKGGAYSIRCVR